MINPYFNYITFLVFTKYPRENVECIVVYEGLELRIEVYGGDINLRVIGI